MHPQPTPNVRTQFNPSLQKAALAATMLYNQKDTMLTEEEVRVQHDAVEELQPAELLQRQLLRPTVHQPHLHTVLEFL